MSSDVLSFVLIIQSLYFTASVLSLVLLNTIYKRRSVTYDIGVALALIFLITPLSLFYSPSIEVLFFSVAISLTLTAILKQKLKSHLFSGVSFYLSSFFLGLIGSVWITRFYLNMPASAITKTLLLLPLPLLILKVPSVLLSLIESYEVLCRSKWNRPKQSFYSPTNYSPFVSIHVPTYSEPPEIVIQTLNKLADVEYTDYEVIVIDNNTKDDALWKPVEMHCKKLGNKFRFFHKENVKGAKAGALNLIHKEIDKRAEVIAVVDADYHADPKFLRSLAWRFSDPKVGFIQTPHDYRGWQHNSFLKMCYWEYKMFFHTAMVSLNEVEAGITVGTMCLIRKKSLEEAGGWSEWCVTEDSELAIRIHNAGYSSVYVSETFGKGLIPETFEGYRKQRYRWTAGPVQEFRHYFKHFLGIADGYANFNTTQRLFHLNHGLGTAFKAANIPLQILLLAIVTSLLINREIISVPIELWISATVTFFAIPLLNFVLYRRSTRITFKNIVGQSLAKKALSHTINLAAFRTLLTGSAAWNRTSKFKEKQTYFSALWSAKEELTIGLGFVSFTVLSIASFPHHGLSLMILIGIGYIALDYLAAPVFALLAVKPGRRSLHNTKRD